jgi:hypothetical protein
MPSYNGPSDHSVGSTPQLIEWLSNPPALEFVKNHMPSPMPIAKPIEPDLTLQHTIPLVVVTYVDEEIVVV